MGDKKGIRTFSEKIVEKHPFVLTGVINSSYIKNNSMIM
jgi:hypothetical protein